jgi:hypothetical protein
LAAALIVRTRQTHIVRSAIWVATGAELIRSLDRVNVALTRSAAIFA